MLDNNLPIPNKPFLPLLLLQLPVQPPILNIGPNGKEQAGAAEGNNGSPAIDVQRFVARLEQLRPDDTRRVGRHDEQRHGDAALAGRACIQRHPRPVDGVPEELRRERHGEKSVPRVFVRAAHQHAVADCEDPEEPEPAGDPGPADAGAVAGFEGQYGRYGEGKGGRRTSTSPGPR